MSKMKSVGRVPAGRANPPTPRFLIKPVTPARWPDLERLFGPKGACGGCWCMWFRLRRSEYEQKKGAGNKRAMKKLVLSGDPPGLIAYLKGDPIAWCALAPREEYSVLERSRVLAPIDDRPVWSIVCMFVAKPHRRQGVSVAMLEAAVSHARKRGARLVEGYPQEPKKKMMPDVFAMTGLASAFQKAGFTEVARRSATRPIMRRALRPSR